MAVLGPATRAGWLTPGNARCRFAATVAALVIAAGAAWGQDGRPETPPPPERAESPAVEEAAGGWPGEEALTPTRALDVFGVVRGWVDRGVVPDEPVAGLPRSWVATVTIRSGGGVIGEDTVAAATEAEADFAIQRAAQRAVRRAVTRLEGEADALRSLRIREGLAQSRVSVEIATQRPVPAAEGVGVDAIDEWIRPGIEGIVVSRGSDRRARTPGQMLSSGQAASGAVVSMIAELADDPALALEPFDSLVDEGFGLSLFRVTHVAQATAGGAPLLLHRGGIVQRPVASQAEVRELADRLASHLMRRTWPGVERFGLRGDLDPVSGRFEPSVAPPFAQGFAAEALIRYANAPGVSGENAERALAAAEAILAALAVVERTERAPWGDPVSASACLSALARLDRLTVDRSDELRGLRERCAAAVKAAWDDKRGFDPLVPVGARGVVARGLVALASFEPWEREAHLVRADAAIRAAYAEVEADRLLTVMPDLGWADIELAEEMGTAPKSAAALREVRGRVLGLQVERGDVIDADRDLVGGFVLDAQGNPLPTWQSLRPTGLLAAMLGDSALTPGSGRGGEALRQIIELTEALRFLRQLMAGDRLGHMYADPGMAEGGLRTSLWEQTMPLTAQALGLMTLAESLESLTAVGARPDPAVGRP